MTDVPAAGRSPRAQDLFSQFGLWDWGFLAALYVLILYLVLQLGLLIFRPGDFDFDFMPLANGALFLWIVWGGFRLDRQLRAIFQGLYQGGSVFFQTTAERDAALQAMIRLGRRYGLISAAVVSLAVLLGILYELRFFTGSQLTWQSGIIDRNGRVALSLPLFAMLVSVSVPAGGMAGYFIGKIIANGRLLDVLHDLGHNLSGFASDSGAETLRALESMYAFATRASEVMCACLAAWSLAFLFRLDIVTLYTDWQIPFLGLWIISFVTFVFAAYRPVGGFQVRLDQIYGGAEARQQMQAQRALAQQDMAALQARIAAAAGPALRRRLDRQLDDLKRFTAALQGLTLQRQILRPMFLRICLVLNLVGFTVAVGGIILFGQPNQPEPQQQQVPLPPPTQQQLPPPPSPKKGALRQMETVNV